MPGQGGYDNPPNYDQRPLMQQEGYSNAGYPPQTQFATYPPGAYSTQTGYGPPPTNPGAYPQVQQGGGYQQQGGYPTAAPNYAAKQTITSMNLVFFAAACCIMFGALISALCFLGSFELVDCLGMCYMVVFGGILAVLDTPFFKTIKAMGDLKMNIGKYINLLTRVTGKGVTFVFLGCSLFIMMWDNLEGAFLLFLAVVLCLFPFVVGLAAIVIGVMKSQKLNKARQHLAMGVLEQRYDQWAQTYRGPQGGLTPKEFYSLTMENGNFTWEDADLKLIFNALVSNPAWTIDAAQQQAQIPKEDLLNWVKGSIVWL